MDYLVEQVRAGAQLLQVFESNAEYLGPEQFSIFSLPFLIEINQKVSEKLRDEKLEVVPMTVFAKGAHYGLAELSKSGYQTVGLDWTMDPIQARNLVGENVTLQGNFDPPALYSSKEDIDKEVKKMCEKFGTQRWIANLGHGIYPDMDPEHVAVFINSVHKHSEVSKK